eukprot:23696-Pleurochrysis_carterae.AAC.1
MEEGADVVERQGVCGVECKESLELSASGCGWPGGWALSVVRCRGGLHMVGGEGGGRGIVLNAVRGVRCVFNVACV